MTPTRANTPTSFRSRASVRSTALREAATFLGLVTFMVLTIALALPHAHIAVILTMVTPLIALILITFLRTPRGRRKELWASLRVRHLGLRSWPVAFVGTLILVLVIPYGVACLLGSADLVPLNSTGSIWLNLLISVVGITLMAMTEEIGWRGFLLPRVQTMVSKRRAALVVGFIHGLFHMPLILLTTTYDGVGNRWIVAPCVMVVVTAAGVFYAWLKDRSGSVWPVALAHGTTNTFIDPTGLVVVVSPLTLAYTAGESGVVTLGSVVGLAVILLIRARTWSATPAVDSARLESGAAADVSGAPGTHSEH